MCPVIRIHKILLAVLVFSAGVAGQQWQPLGPDGGTVRSLTFDPNDPDRIFLGTSAGVVYLSRDHGQNWLRLARLGSPEEMVVDHIVIDPANSEHLYAAAWNAQAPNNDGDLWAVIQQTPMATAKRERGRYVHCDW